MNQESKPTSEFKNEKVSIQLTQEPGCLVKLDVAVAPVISTSSYQEAMKRVRKEVSIPGFRKGKAPDSLIVSHYSKAIEKEWRDCLLQEAFEESIRLTRYFPLKSAARGIKSNIKTIGTPTDPAQVHFQYESEPHVPSIDPSNIQLVQKRAPDVSEEELASFIEDARLMLATWEDVQDRTAEAEDYVRLDIDKIHGDHTHSEFKDKRFKISPQKMSSWLMQLVIGLSVGQTAEGTSAPEEALDKDLDEQIKAAFKPAPYRVTLKAIEKPSLPELNDEFAQKLGASSLEDMREKLRHQLLQRAEMQSREALSKQLEEMLIRQYAFDLPKSQIEKEMKVLQDLKVNQLRSAGELTDQEIAREMPMIHRKARQESERDLTLFYLLRDYNHKNGISVTQEEMNQEVTNVLRNVPQEHLQELVKSLDENVYRTILTNLITTKGIQHLLNHVKIINENDPQS